MIGKRTTTKMEIQDSRRTGMEKLINICMRSILGIIAMYFINSALEKAGISLGVGINMFTVLTSGILGFPGLLALYGIGVYRFL
jgi:pro-sigmaK processing inhibitor BofA